MKLTQHLHKDPAEAITLKELGPAIGAGGDKLQLPRLVAAAVGRHNEEISAEQNGVLVSRRATLCASPLMPVAKSGRARGTNSGGDTPPRPRLRASNLGAAPGH